MKNMHALMHHQKIERQVPTQIRCHSDSATNRCKKQNYVFEFTPPKTKISHENQCKILFPLEMVPFWGTCQFSGGYIYIYIYIYALVTSSFFWRGPEKILEFIELIFSHIWRLLDPQQATHQPHQPRKGRWIRRCFMLVLNL